MTQNMVEKVAGAIEHSRAQEEWLACARAAIEALRDPSNDMMAAMFTAMFEEEWDGTQAPMCGAGFEAAIDAALEEGEDE